MITSESPTVPTPRARRAPDLTFVIEQLQNQLDDLTETVRLQQEQIDRQASQIRALERV
ncbi:hypothetical protein FHX74_000444 [Friedmanniella endophytica]|uniref:Uncharacterized protein n=1 Tax=Microlunatus kandeliicorticis TaxID=1759536 RepID=A0A7W3IPI8_9ACTN|nr:hypothetical protein [Microlunatus kandeliicorticis]MBA8792850.1 hypothetical protein [Microlunatus kandeliicorticis]